MSLKRFDDALQTLRALQAEERSAAVTNAIGVAELRRTATPQPGRATYYFSQATRDRSRRTAICSSTWATPIGSIVTRAPPSTGCARRCGAIPATAMRISFSARRCSRPARPPRRRASASWRRGCRRSTRSGKDVRAPASRCRAGSSGWPMELTPSAPRVDAILTTAGQRDQDALAAFHLDAGRRAYQREADREAIAGVAARPVSVAVPGGSAPAAGPPVPAGRPGRGGRRGVEDCALERRDRRRPRRPWPRPTSRCRTRRRRAVEVDRALALDPKSADALALKAKIGGGPW